MKEEDVLLGEDNTYTSVNYLENLGFRCDDKQCLTYHKEQVVSD